MALGLITGTTSRYPRRPCPIPASACPAAANLRDVEPTRKLAIVTCMDCRLDVAAAVGLQRGDAHVLRNAGGIVTDDVIRSLAISQRKLGTREVLVIQHTDCGMEKIDDEGFRAELEEDAGVAPDFPIGAFADVENSVRESVRRIRESPFVPHRDSVRGYVYEVDAHQVREVEV
jgi:carbonic anhydrase